MEKEKLLRQVWRTMARFGMISPGQRLAVACSGGPDSTALLLLLHELSSQLGCLLSVCHFNHRLRGEQSDQDEQFVRELAERLHLGFHVGQADVRANAERSGENLEGKARELRYGFFGALIDSGQADRVAVGHTADDQAETVVHRFLRGSGTRGLAGIYPVVENRIVRPLIETRRQAILEWLEKRRQPWRQDSSNLDLRHTRNRIRHQLLPLLAEFNPGIVGTLADTAVIARDEENFWQSYLSTVVSDAVAVREGKDSPKIWIQAGKLREMHPAVARRLLRWALGRARESGTAGPRPPSDQRQPPAGKSDFEQIQRLLRLAGEGQSGRSLPLAGNLVAKREFAHLIIGQVETRKEMPGFEYCVRVPAEVHAPEIGSTFSLEIVPMKMAQTRYNDPGTSLLDPGLAETILTLRNWRAGDAYKPKGFRTQRKLKELFQRRRIAVSERPGWPLLLAGSRIIWARKLGVAEEFAPPPESDRALLLTERLW